MCKLLSILTGLILLVSISAQETGDWKEVEKKINYKSKGFSCDIIKDGSIYNLCADNMLLIENSLLHGRYKIPKGKKYDNRFFQRFKKENPLKWKKTGKNSYIFEKNGVLSNKKYKPGAKYTEKITLSPYEITIAIELELLVPLASHSNIFCSLNYLPLETFICKGFRLNKTNGKSKLMVFPQNYSKETKLHIVKAKSIMISLEKGIFEISAQKNSVLSISDTRSYNGKAFRIDINEKIPWQAKAIEFPAGKVFKWSYKYIYKKAD